MINTILSALLYVFYSLGFYNIFKWNYKDKKWDFVAVLEVSNYVAYIIMFTFNIATYDYDIDIYDHLCIFTAVFIFSVLVSAIIDYVGKKGKIEIGIYIVTDIIFAICSGFYILYTMVFHLSVDTLYPTNNFDRVLVQMLVVSLSYVIFYIISYVYIRVVKETGLLFWLAQGVLLLMFLGEIYHCLYGTAHKNILKIIDKSVDIAERFILWIPLIYLSCIIIKVVKMNRGSTKTED